MDERCKHGGEQSIRGKDHAKDVDGNGADEVEHDDFSGTFGHVDSVRKVVEIRADKDYV